MRKNETKRNEKKLDMPPNASSSPSSSSSPMDAIEPISTQGTLVAHVLVVAFHPTTGNTIEFAYPLLRPTTNLRSPKLTDTLDITLTTPPSPHISTSNPTYTTKGTWGYLPTPWTLLPFLALPDGSHNLPSDTIYFTLPPNVHALAHYRQQPQLHPTTTRQKHPIQKSVILLLKRPFHTLLTHELHLATTHYFHSNFQNTTPLINLYHKTNTLLQTLPLKSPSQTYHKNLSLTTLLKTISPPTLLSLLKLIILEKHIIIYSQPVFHASNAIFALVSLFPAAFDQISSPNLPNIYPLSKRETDYGFPLNLFQDDGIVVQGHAPLMLLGRIVDDGKRGCLVGTSMNVGVLLASGAKGGGGGGGSKEKKVKGVDVLVNLNRGKVAVSGKLEGCCRLSKVERRFMGKVMTGVERGEFDGKGSGDEFVRGCLMRWLEGLFGCVARVEGVLGGPLGDTWSKEMVDGFFERDGDVGGDGEGVEVFGKEFVREWLVTRNCGDVAKRWKRGVVDVRSVGLDLGGRDDERVEEENGDESGGGVWEGVKGGFWKVGQLAEAGVEGVGRFFRGVEEEMARLESAIGAGGSNDKGKAKSDRNMNGNNRNSLQAQKSRSSPAVMENGSSRSKP